MIAPGSTISLWKGVFPPGRKTMPEMAEDVAIMYGVRVEDIRGWNRQVRFTVPRHHFAWLAYQQPHLSLNMIGQFLGGRDHSTVLNSLRRHAERMALEEAA